MPSECDSRKRAHQLLKLVEDGILDSAEVLKNLLTNYMSSDDANDFAECEYSDYLPEEND